MDLLAVGALAPQFRLSLETSKLLAGPVFGFGLVAGVTVSSGIALLAWSRARRLTEEVWRRRGLHAGPILLTGVAERIEDQASSSPDEDPQRPLIELAIEQTGTLHQSKQGPYLRWAEVSRTLHERPFQVRTDSGDRVRVEPQGRIDLVDRLEPAPRTIGKAVRTRRARIDVGDRLWVRGVLDRRGAAVDQGPYRGGAQHTGDVLRPPARGALFVSSEPIEAEDRASAKFHATFAALYLVLLGLAQLLLFSDFHALRARGVGDEASIVGGRSWITRSKRNVTHHYAWTLRYLDGEGNPHEHEEETSGSAYYRVPRGTLVPIVYLPSAPDTMQLGRSDELGTTTGRAAFIGILFGLLLGCHIAVGGARRPWWRKRALVETERGTL